MTVQMMQSLQSKTEIIFIDGFLLNEPYLRRSEEFCNKLGYSTMIEKYFVMRRLASRFLWKFKVYS